MGARRAIFILLAALGACGGKVAPDDEPHATRTGGTFDVDAATSPPPRDPRLVPLAAGRTWTYRVSLAGEQPNGGTFCGEGIHRAEVLAVSTTADGHTSYRYQPVCGLFVVDVVELGGDRMTAARDDAPWYTWVYVDTPIEDGHRWPSMQRGAYETWRGPLTREALGETYDDCWQRVDGDGVSFVTFCRGIGEVELYFPNENWRAELVGKNW